MELDEHQQLVEVITKSIEDHRQKQVFHSFVFYFTSPEYGQRETMDNPCVNEIVEAFRAEGYNPQMCDTVPHAANLNRDWWEVECDKCIREWGFTLPLFDNVDAMARIVELEHSGKVQFIVYEQDDEQIE